MFVFMGTEITRVRRIHPRELIRVQALMPKLTSVSVHVLVLGWTFQRLKPISFLLTFSLRWVPVCPRCFQDLTFCLLSCRTMKILLG